MRVLLVGAELEENLALRSLWSALKTANHEVCLIRFDGPHHLDAAAFALAASGAPLAAFSMVFTYRAAEFAALASRARTLGYRGHIVAGGHFATLNAEALLRDVEALDSVGCGEGENLMLDLAANLRRPARVRGLVWRAPDGSIQRNPPAPKPDDLDALPWPERKKPCDQILGLPIANMLASRGCTHACAFCSIAAWHRHCGGARFRLRDPRRVAAEMAALYHDGVRIFNFHDDNFILQDRAQTFARLALLERELRERGVGRIAFAIKARPDSIDRDLFSYLKSIGLFRVFLGIEAGTTASLRALGRGQTLRQNEQALARVNALGIHACFNMLLLGPDSTLEDFQANVAFLRRHPRNPMNFCRTEIYAGTPLEAALRRDGRLIGDYWGYDYRIGDPRAQAAFELIYECFAGRNAGLNCLQHVTMDVDYQHQLLVHFKGVRPRLRRRVKDYLVRVNLNTCGYLDEVAHAAAEGLASPHSRSTFAAGLTARIAEDNGRLAAEGDALLAEIRAAFQEEPRHAAAPWRRRAAVAGLAATLALGCGKEPFTFQTEMAPNPVVLKGNELLTQKLKVLLPHVARHLDHPGDVTVKVSFFNTGGKIRLVSGKIIKFDGVAAEIPLDDINNPVLSGISMDQILLGDPNVSTQNYNEYFYDVTFTRDEVAATMKAQAPTPRVTPNPPTPTPSPTPTLTPRVPYIAEVAPLPLVTPNPNAPSPLIPVTTPTPRPSQMFEMIPPPRVTPDGKAGKK